MDIRNAKQVVTPNLCESYIDAQANYLRIVAKAESLREKGNFKSMNKVINDELLKASIKRNKALSAVQDHLDAIAEAKLK